MKVTVEFRLQFEFDHELPRYRLVRELLEAELRDSFEKISQAFLFKNVEAQTAEVLDLTISE